MRVDAISDTHEHLEKGVYNPQRTGFDPLEVELFVLVGDFTPPTIPPNSKEAVEYLQDLLDYLRSHLENAEIVVGPGNHDPPEEMVDEVGLDIPEGVYYLENGDTVSTRGKKICYCSAVPRNMGIWTHECQPSTLRDKTAQLEDAQILLTHAPPKGILDIASTPVGNEYLHHYIEQASSLEIIFCGHCHEQGGRMTTVEGKNQRVKVYNVANEWTTVRI